jgi:hypothetical protein
MEEIMDKKISIRITREQYDWLVSRGNPSMVIRSIVSDKMSDKVVSPQDKSVVSDKVSDKVVLSDKILSDNEVVSRANKVVLSDKRKKRVKVSDNEVVECLKDSILEHQEQCGGILPAFGMSMYEFMQCPADARSQWGLTGGRPKNGVFKVWYEKSSWKYLNPKDVYTKEVV